jgi:hypothetical protein
MREKAALFYEKNFFFGIHPMSVEKKFALIYITMNTTRKICEFPNTQKIIPFACCFHTQ